MSIHTRIFLTGFMGTGKSTLGPKLAMRLGYRFVDLDADIAAESGMSIPEIFSSGGEAAFRQLEAEAVDRITRASRVVVGLGGGVVANAELRRQLKAAGVLVCLQVSMDRLTARLSRSGYRRPLLLGADGEPLLGDALARRILDLYDARRDAYSDSHVTVNVEASSKGQSVDRIEDAIRAFSRESGP